MDKTLFDKAVELRHEIHAHPDLSNQERPTFERIIAFLKENAPSIEILDRGHYVLARYKAADPKKPPIAFRADVDAILVYDDIDKPWSEDSQNNTINMYFSEIKPVEEPAVEEPVIEEPVKEEPIAEEPAVEEPVIEEPVVEEPEVTEPEIIADEEVPEAAPVIEEVEEIEETIRPRHKSEKAEPIVETSTDETKVEEIEEIAEELEEEEIADEEAPLASFEVAEAETTEIAEVLVKSPLTGDNRNTGAWAGLSLASLLGILYLSRKRKVTE